MQKKHKKIFDEYIYLFQGGGALGAYQVGVFKGLTDSGYAPDWLVGTSIGAINSAIIAGNLPKDRIKKLERFWQTISTKINIVPESLNNIMIERWQHYLSSELTLRFGQPGFFEPRLYNPVFGIESTPDKLSFYSTDELRDNLSQLINLDIINEKKVRLSMGAANVRTGELVYFDNARHYITMDHIMASCALPPSFPAVQIGDHYYWDGAVHSNTQINFVLNECSTKKSLCFMVHLFNSYDLRPYNMDDIMKRQKDIFYSSHHHTFIQIYQHLHELRHGIKKLSKVISQQNKKDPEIKKILDLGHTGILHLARFHIASSPSDLSSKDYEFSEVSINKHIAEGCRDVNKVGSNPPWFNKADDSKGLIIHEISESPIPDECPITIGH